MEFVIISLILSIFAAFPVALVALCIALKNRSDLRRLSKENEILRARLTGEVPAGQSPAKAAPAAITPAARPATAATTPRKTETPTPEKSAVTPSATAKKPEPTPKPRNLESVFGKNVLAIAATALIFVGMIAFGVLIFTQITDTVKILGMFLAAFAITGAGVFLSRKNRNAFTETLAGCGVGAVYISILITHLYFERIGDLAAFGLILLWGAGLFLLSRWIKARSLVYVAHFGCILSTVLSVGYGQVTEKYVEITIYQMVTFALLLMANRKEKILHTLCGYASVILNGVLCIIMVPAASGDRYGSMTLGVFGLLLLLLNLFNAGIYALSLRNNALGITGTFCTNLVALFAFLTGFGCGVSYFNKAVPLFFSDPLVWEEAAYGLALLATILLSVLTGALVYLLTRRSAALSALLTGHLLAATVLVWTGIALDSLPLAVLPALTAAGLAWWLRHKGDRIFSGLFRAFGLGLLLTDGLISLFFLGDHPYAGVFYSLLLLAGSVLLVKGQTGSIKGFPFFQLALTDLHLFFTAATLSDELWTEVWPALMLITGLNLLYHLLCKHTISSPTVGQRVSALLSEIGESAWILGVGIYITVTTEGMPEPGTGGNTLPLLLLCLMLLPAGLADLPGAITKRNPGLAVWQAIKCTLLAFLPISQFTDWFDEQFIVSVFFMLVAAGCILLGFLRDLKAVRIYGLALILASVLKMVIADVWNQDSLIRVVSLIAGGVICFAISAGYSAAERRKGKTQKSDNDA